MAREDQLEQTDDKNAAVHETRASHGRIKDFFTQHGPLLGMVVLIGYLILLGIGVFAEVFDIQWILDWWIWSPPGKFK